MKLKLSVVGLILSIQVWGQDPEFSQKYRSGMYLNPALVGENDKWTVMFIIEINGLDLKEHIKQHPLAYSMVLESLLKG